MKKKKIQFNLVIQEAFKEEFQRYCEEEDMRMSAVIRMLMKGWLKEKKQQEV